MTLTTTKWTVEDYHRMIDAGILAGHHVELINGEIIEMSPEGSPHAKSEPDLAIVQAEYWVVNLKDLKLVVFRNPLDDNYRSQQELTTGKIKPLAFPDIAVSVVKVLN